MEIRKSLVGRVFCDIRFAAVIFFLLALCTLLGSFFPQENLVGRKFLLEKFGTTKYYFFEAVGLTDIFNSWWYLFLVLLLYLSLISVSFGVVFPRAKKAFNRYRFLSFKNFYKLKNSTQNQSKKNFLYQVWEKETEKENLSDLKESLEKKSYQVELSPDKFSLVAQKNQIFRLAAAITHVGILIILLAAFLNLLFGFSGLILGSPGDLFGFQTSEKSFYKPVSIFHSQFWLGKVPQINLKIIDTKQKLNEAKTPEQWTTQLGFQTRKEVSRTSFKSNSFDTKALIYVNKPFRFIGVDFYQAAWQEYFEFKFNKKLFKIKAESSSSDQETKTGKLKINEDFQLFFFRAGSSQKVNLIVLENLSKKQEYRNFLFNTGEEKQINNLMKIKYLGLKKETGLQIKYRPFDWLIYLGMLFLISGVLSSLIRTKLIWVVFNQKEKKIESLILN